MNLLKLFLLNCIQWNESFIYLINDKRIAVALVGYIHALTRPFAKLAPLPTINKCRALLLVIQINDGAFGG